MSGPMADRVASMSLLDWLDDLTVRFLLNLPPAEMSSMPRLCFQVEEAQWFYEDFVRPANPQLPSLNLRQFCLTLFQHSPLLSGFTEAQHAAAYEEFLAYKVRVPVRGAILMDQSMTKVLLVRGWKKGSSWSFPRGKINRDEADLDCAVREVYEETGYDVNGAGLVHRNMQNGEVKAIDITMREQHMRLFVFRGVPLDTHFEPRTRREIGGIEWYNVKDLPGFKKHKGQVGHGQGDALSTKFYMVAPFLPQLKKWIAQQTRAETEMAGLQAMHGISVPGQASVAPITEDEPHPGMLPTTHESVASSAAQHVQPSGASVQDQGNALLAMLRGNNVAPTGVNAWQQLAHELPQQIRTDANNARQQAGIPAASGPVENTLLETFHRTIGSGDVLGGPLRREAPQHTVHHASNSHPTFAQSSGLIPVRPDAQVSHAYPTSQGIRYGSGAPSIQQEYASDFDHNRHPSAGGSHFITPSHGQHLQHAAVQPNPFYNLTNSTVQSDPAHQRSQTLLELFQQPNAPKIHDNHTAPMQPLPASTPHMVDPRTGMSQPSSNLLQSLAQQISPPLAPHTTGQFGNPPHHPYQPTQGQNGPIADGPAVPEASNLPAPTLNPHAMKLLDAFKGPLVSKTPVASIETGQKAEGQNANQHQSALLNLFGKSLGPLQAQIAKPAEVHEMSAIASPIVLDETKLPPSQGILTMEAPIRPKEQDPSAAKTQAPIAPPAPNNNKSQKRTSAKETQVPKSKDHLQQNPTPDTKRRSPAVTSTERPKSRGQLFDPAKAPKSSSASPSQTKGTRSPSTPSQTAQSRPGPRGNGRSAETQPKQRAVDNSQATPQFSILQRPGSSAGRPSIPHSPLRAESSASGFKPQVLRRAPAEPDAAAIGVVEKSVSVPVAMAPSSESKDHLLALFGKPASSAPAPIHPPSVMRVPSEQGVDKLQQKDKLLTLLSAKSPAPSVKTPEPSASPRSMLPPPTKSPLPTLQPSLGPPSAPQLLPEARASSRQSQSSASGTSQQLLLNLFNNANAATVASPGTPISPFTLGTPISRFPATNKIIGQDLPVQPRSRLGSFQTAGLAPATSSGQPTPTSPTPTETKEFLLGYLNGVVKKEGQQGGGRS